MRSLSAAGVAILLGATTAASQTGVRHERVAGNVWRIDGAVDVLLVQTGPDGTLLVDTGYPFAEAGVRQALREIAGGEEVTRLINTHSHHAFANHLYAGDAEIVAQERAARRIAGGFLMAGQAVPAALPEARPSRTFADSLRLHMNGEDITLLHLPGAHTDGDVAVIFHGSNVVATGDVLVPHMSWVNLDEGAGLEGLLESLDLLLRVVPEGARIVPGHDPVTLDKDDLRAFRDMIVSAADTVRARMAAGLSLRRIQALGLPWLESWRGRSPRRSSSRASTAPWSRRGALRAPGRSRS